MHAIHSNLRSRTPTTLKPFRDASRRPSKLQVTSPGVSLPAALETIPPDFPPVALVNNPVDPTTPEIAPDFPLVDIGTEQTLNITWQDCSSDRGRYQRGGERSDRDFKRRRTRSGERYAGPASLQSSSYQDSSSRRRYQNNDRSGGPFYRDPKRRRRTGKKSIFLGDDDGYSGVSKSSYQDRYNPRTSQSERRDRYKDSRGRSSRDSSKVRRRSIEDDRHYDDLFLDETMKQQPRNENIDTLDTRKGGIGVPKALQHQDRGMRKTSRDSRVDTYIHSAKEEGEISPSPYRDAKRRRTIVTKTIVTSSKPSYQTEALSQNCLSNRSNQREPDQPPHDISSPKLPSRSDNPAVGIPLKQFRSVGKRPIICGAEQASRVSSPYKQSSSPNPYLPESPSIPCMPETLQRKDKASSQSWVDVTPTGYVPLFRKIEERELALNEKKDKAKVAAIKSKAQSQSRSHTQQWDNKCLLDVDGPEIEDVIPILKQMQSPDSAHTVSASVPSADPAPEAVDKKCEPPTEIICLSPASDHTLSEREGADVDSGLLPSEPICISPLPSDVSIHLSPSSDEVLMDMSPSPPPTEEIEEEENEVPLPSPEPETKEIDLTAPANAGENAISGINETENTNDLNTGQPSRTPTTEKKPAPSKKIIPKRRPIPKQRPSPKNQINAENNVSIEANEVSKKPSNLPHIEEGEIAETEESPSPAFSFAEEPSPDRSPTLIQPEPSPEPQPIFQVDPKKSNAETVAAKKPLTLEKPTIVTKPEIETKEEPETKELTTMKPKEKVPSEISSRNKKKKKKKKAATQMKKKQQKLNPTTNNSPRPPSENKKPPDGADEQASEKTSTTAEASSTTEKPAKQASGTPVLLPAFSLNEKQKKEQGVKRKPPPSPSLSPIEKYVMQGGYDREKHSRGAKREKLSKISVNGTTNYPIPKNRQQQKLRYAILACVKKMLKQKKIINKKTFSFVCRHCTGNIYSRLCDKDDISKPDKMLRRRMDKIKSLVEDEIKKTKLAARQKAKRLSKESSNKSSKSQT